MRGFRITADFLSHPGATLGFRLETANGSLAYLPDHEPALGARHFPEDAEWTSGRALAEGVDLLIHDAQYTEQEYAVRPGWGHSTLEQALAFAALAGVGRLCTFHHDPGHSDAMLASNAAEVRARSGKDVDFVVGMEGETYAA